MRKQIYAVYKGDKFQFHGTLDDIADVTMLSKSTIRNYSSPSYHKKIEGTDALKILKISGGFR
jgi:hypothetical protein